MKTLLFCIIVSTVLCFTNGQWSALIDSLPKQTTTCLSKTTHFCGDLYRTEKEPNGPCTATYGGFRHHLASFQDFTNEHLKQSAQFLLMSSHFKTYKMNRLGFSKLFREMSDSAWKDAIDLIHYVNSRGGHHHNATNEQSSIKMEIPDGDSYELNELNSLAAALDKQKYIAEMAHSLHKMSDKKNPGQHDAEMNEYLEKEFVRQHSARVRSLAGHVTNLADMMRSHDNKLSLYLFDQILQ